MTIREFAQLKKYIDEQTEGLEQSEANSVKKNILNKAGFFLQEYNKIEELLDAEVNSKVSTEVSDAKDGILNTLQGQVHAEMESLHQKIDNQKPKIINKIVNKIIKVIEKPKTIKETVYEDNSTHETYDDSKIREDIKGLKDALSKIDIPEIDYTKIKNDFESEFGENLKKNIDVLNMPDFRKLAMGLDARIGELEANPASGSSFGTDNQIPFTNLAGDDFDYTPKLTYDGTTQTLWGNTAGNSDTMLSVGNETSFTERFNVKAHGGMYSNWTTLPANPDFGYGWNINIDNVGDVNRVGIRETFGNTQSSTGMIGHLMQVGTSGKPTGFMARGTFGTSSAYTSGGFGFLAHGNTASQSTKAFSVGNGTTYTERAYIKTDGESSFLRSILGGGLRLIGYTSAAADPTTTELPTDKDCAIHKNTSSGDVFLAFNDGGSTIKKVALT